MKRNLSSVPGTAGTRAGGSPSARQSAETPQRMFGALEREIIYYQDGKRCGECDADVIWSEAEIHHVDQHSQGGKTALENGALVHRHCHPKGAVATEQFTAKWRQRRAAASVSGPSVEELEESEENEEAI